MAVTWAEQWGRKTSTRSAERLFYGTTDVDDTIGGDDDLDAYEALRAASATTFISDGSGDDTPGGDDELVLMRTDIEVNEIEGHEDAWLGVVRYGSPENVRVSPLEVGVTQLKFSTRGGTKHTTQSIADVGRYVAGGDTMGGDDTMGGGSAVDHQGAINVGKHKVDGVEIVVPTYAFNLTCIFPNTFITDAYKAVLITMTGRTNNALFFGCEAGECLFMGVDGSPRNDSEYELNFAFMGSANRYDFVINPSAPMDEQITVASKLGWEYLWIEYEDAEDGDRMIKKPIQANVVQIYQSGDLSTLGIGTS